MVERRWLSAKDASVYTGRSGRTVLDAARAGELRGAQTGKFGHWSFLTEWLDAWMSGEPAPVEVPVVTRRRAS